MGREHAASFSWLGKLVFFKVSVFGSKFPRRGEKKKKGNPTKQKKIKEKKKKKKRGRSGERLLF